MAKLYGYINWLFKTSKLVEIHENKEKQFNIKHQLCDN